MSDHTSVRVAVRVRPLVPNELSRGYREVLDVVKENEQIIIKNIDKDKAYAFNYVMSTHSPQEEIYKQCVQPLMGNLFKGYNVTILAYGQTGSGKTHTMGTAYMGDGDMGVIPRAVNEIFDFIKDNFSFDFTITVSFMELYQDVLYDLLSDKPREQCVLEIREDTAKGIHIPSLTEVDVISVKSILETLQKGTSRRTTSSTAMNAHSSRSHVIFSVNITMNSKENCHENKRAKLYFVDLAGSERLKKTGAIGNTFKEGVHINQGLFVLGNVISCLGDEKAQHGFIPYRDSNLTRLLKGSRAKKIIEKVQTMAEAKYFNKFFFARVAEMVKEKVSLQIKLSELQEMHNEPQDKLKDSQNEYEEKVALLMNQINRSPDLASQVEICLKQIDELKRQNEELAERLVHVVNVPTSPKTRVLVDVRTFWKNKPSPKTRVLGDVGTFWKNKPSQKSVFLN